MLKRCEEKLIEDLALMDKEEFNTLITQVQEKREELHREELRDAFNAFNESWERMEELGYYPVIPLESGEGEISLDIIIWREEKRKEN